MAVIVENSGYGGTFAAPIAGLMMEKYLNDTISVGKKPVVQKMLETVTMDPVVIAKSKLDLLNGATARLSTEQILREYFRN